jgi:hypothetical protein
MQPVQSKETQTQSSRSCINPDSPTGPCQSRTWPSDALSVSRRSDQPLEPGCNADLAVPGKRLRRNHDFDRALILRKSWLSQADLYGIIEGGEFTAEGRSTSTYQCDWRRPPTSRQRKPKKDQKTSTGTRDRRLHRALPCPRPAPRRIQPGPASAPSPRPPVAGHSGARTRRHRFLPLPFLPPPSPAGRRPIRAGRAAGRSGCRRSGPRVPPGPRSGPPRLRRSGPPCAESKSGGQ